MSYSFTVTGDFKEEAEYLVAKEMSQIILQQPNHRKDFDAVLANAKNALSLLADDPTKSVRVQCHGSLMWVDDPDQVTGVNISANAWYVPKGAA